MIFGVFRISETFLRTPAAPNGIVSFELAGSVGSAQDVVDSWDSKASLHAAFGLGLDYLFMPVYAFALSFGLLLAIGEKKGWYRFLASFMGWAVFIAALFDAVENYALWHVLDGNAISPFPQIAALCATIKFAILIIGLLTAAARFLVKEK
jgi:hypothetical protein